MCSQNASNVNSRRDRYVGTFPALWLVINCSDHATLTEHFVHYIASRDISALDYHSLFDSCLKRPYKKCVQLENIFTTFKKQQLCNCLIEQHRKFPNSIHFDVFWPNTKENPLPWPFWPSLYYKFSSKKKNIPKRRR